MKKYEYCCQCGEATGRAGVGEDSLYTANAGPFCEDCYPEVTSPAAQPTPEQYAALEQALTRLQKRYGELEAKVAAQPAPVKTYHDGKPWPIAPKPWVGLTDEEAQWIYDNGRTPAGMMEMVEAKLKEKNT